MKKTILFFGITSMLLFVNSGCDKFLTVDPPYTQDAENFFETPEDFERALTGAYDLLQGSFMSLWIGEIASDNSIAGGESVNDSQGLHQIDEMTHGGVNNDLRSLFRWNYAGLTRANYLLENQDKIDFVGKDVIVGEAKFLRAYYYFELVKFFGDVPLIVDKRIGIEEALTLERTPASEVYAQIEADLIAASSVLTFDQVIGEGVYSLVSNYEEMFTAANENNLETVFDIQYSGLEGGGYGCLICLEGNAAPGFHGIRQYNGPVYGDGNSYNLPTQALYDAFSSADPRRDATILDIEAFIANQQNPGDISYAIGAGGHSGFYNNKYIKRIGEIGLPDNDLTSPVNYRVIRYSDVLLMAAEAHYQNGNTGLAQQLVNQVRGRVGIQGISLSSVNDIYTERRYELSGEGHRFFDLVRTGQASSFIPGFQTGKHELFPIPQAEIDLTGGNWAQNPGY